MSKRTKSPTTSPSAFADRLFARLTAIYGSQKMAAMWGSGASPDAPAAERERAARELKAVWAETLSAFHIDVVAGALRDLAMSAHLWPPTLPEMVQMCREADERMKSERRVLALPAPSDVAPRNSPAAREFRAELARFLAHHAARRRLAQEREPGMEG